MPLLGARRRGVIWSRTLARPGRGSKLLDRIVIVSRVSLLLGSLGLEEDMDRKRRKKGIEGILLREVLVQEQQ